MVVWDWIMARMSLANMKMNIFLYEYVIVPPHHLLSPFIVCLLVLVLQTVWTQNKTSGLIWIQTVRNLTGIPVRCF